MKFLLHSHFPVGHGLPMQAVAQALVNKGHEVLWLAAAGHAALVKATGARFVATKAIAASKTGILDEDYAMHENRLLSQVADYRAVLADFAADALLVDVFPYGARALHDLGEIPTYATLGVIPFYTSNPRSPLPTSGARPAARCLDVVKNDFWHLVNQWITLPYYLRPIINSQRKELGLSNVPFGEAPECFKYSPFLHLQASSAQLEFYQEPKPQSHRQNVVYVGPLVRPEAGLFSQLPTWWSNIVIHKRVIGITQGTLATNPISLIVPAIRALVGYPDALLVVMSPHIEAIAARVGTPDNVLYAKWLPYHLLLPQLSLLVTNGGYGSITQALSHAVPLICAGQTEDKMDTAARVAWCGAGIDLKTDIPSAGAIDIAARVILSSSRYRERAKNLGLELNMLGGGRRAAYELEELAIRANESLRDEQNDRRRCSIRNELKVDYVRKYF
ncbi:4'-demethylrebeccamycin synthase-like protein [Cladobotryum mycophilum]|uniref:4'-demethylrebeccamycin synthase-like protein n=1 Tax=Cladobotryum mycophilum TaxID=491253 RepID=A0ABR0STK3_9HYPO